MRMRWVAAVAIAAAGAGACAAVLAVDDVQYAPGGGGDAAADTAPRDGASDGGGLTPCHPSTPFRPPVLVAGLDRGNEEWATFTANELSAIVTRSTSLSDDLFAVNRSVLAASFTVGTPLGSLNTQSPERRPSLSGDGGLLVFATGESSSLTVQVSRSEDGGWSVPSLFVANGTDPYLVGDRVYYVESGGLLRRGLTDTSSVPMSLNGDVESPVLSSNELVLYLAARTAAGGAGETDIHFVRRPDRERSFDVSTAALVPELTNTAFDRPVWLSPDDCSLYFVSGRGGSNGVWVARKR